MRTAVSSPVSPARRRQPRHALGHPPGPNPPAGLDPDSYRAGARSVIAVQERRHRRIRWGAAFLGWLAAIGAAMMLAVSVTMAGAAVGLVPGTGAGAVVVTVVVALTIVLAASVCGGYVAGRMARFDGVRQGIAVWLWTVVTTVLLAVALTFADTELGAVDVRGALSRLGIDAGELPGQGSAAVLVAVAGAVAALGGAVLGGRAGMRFHRRIDRDSIENGIEDDLDDALGDGPDPWVAVAKD